MHQGLHAWLIGTLVAGTVAGCATTPQSSDGTNEALSIVRFENQETADKSTVIGLDANNHEVARLELVHGTFTLSPSFAEDYTTPTVDGRKLNVFIGDVRKLNWETAGYDPTMHMPAHPPSEWKLIEFLEDSHVKPILDRWQIGFEPTIQDTSLDNETAYIPYDAIQGQFYGTNAVSCANQTTCGTVQNKTINLCAGDGSAATRAIKAYDMYWNQYKIGQCCPSGEFGPFWAIKTCPVSGSASECGTGTGACKGCPEYPVSDLSYCQVWRYDSQNVHYWYEAY